jgi:hypothetical protein
MSKYDQMRNGKGQIQICANCGEDLDVYNICANHSFTSLLCDRHCECNEPEKEE